MIIARGKNRHNQQQFWIQLWLAERYLVLLEKHKSKVVCAGLFILRFNEWEPSFHYVNESKRRRKSNKQAIEEAKRILANDVSSK